MSNFKSKYNLFGIPISCVLLFLLGMVTALLGTLLSVLFMFLWAYLLFLWVCSLYVRFSNYSDSSRASKNSFIFYCAVFPSAIVIAFLLLILIKHGPQKPRERYKERRQGETAYYYYSAARSMSLS